MTKERKRLIKKLDDLWRLRIKERAGWRCERCLNYFPEGHRQGLDAAHIFSRRTHKIRWDLRNGLALCMGDHMWAHTHPLEFHEWAKEKFGETYDMLLKKKNKVSRIDYDEILKELEGG